MTAASSSLDGLHDPEALPPLTDVNRPYFAAAARGVLVFQRCANGHPFLYPRLVCPVCHDGELAWETAAGTGEIVSFAPVYRPPWDSFPRSEPVRSRTAATGPSAATRTRGPGWLRSTASSVIGQ